MNTIKDAENVLAKLIEELAIYAGFNPLMGLFKGRLGLVIVLFSASSYFKKDELKDIAESMLDDILEEAQGCNDFSFSEGLMGLGWGVSYLMEQGFIEQDDDFFHELDEKLSDIEYLSTIINYHEVAFLGLYHNQRKKITVQPGFFDEQLFKYFLWFVQSPKIPDDLLTENDYSLIPFFYCIDLARENDAKNSILDEIEYLFQKKYCNKRDKYIFSPKKSFDKLMNIKNFGHSIDWNDHFLSFNQLISLYSSNLYYKNNFDFPAINRIELSLGKILNDEILLDNINQLISPYNMGLTQPFSGFIWALLNYCFVVKKEILSEEKIVTS